MPFRHASPFLRCHRIFQKWPPGGWAWFLASLALTAVPAASGQVPKAIAFGKIGYHAQSSATSVSPLDVGFVVEVDFFQIPQTSISVALQKPNGTTVALDRQQSGSYFVSQYFSNESQLASAYPNGSYTIVIAGGSAPNSVTFDAAVNVATPVRLTNFDTLQTAGATAAPVWQPISAQGSSEFLDLELWSTGNVELSNTEFPNARATTGTLSGLAANESYFGVLYYLSFSSSYPNNGKTELLLLSGFQLVFPVLRGVSTPVIPGPPPTAGAYASGPTEATITWQTPTSTSPATAFKIQRASESTFQIGLVNLAVNSAVTSYVDTSVSPGSTYYYRVLAVNAAGTSAPTTEMLVQTPPAAGVGATRFVNIATRAYCSTGNSVTIGGFVVDGTGTKRVIVRAVGPSLTAQGIGASEALLDPSIEVFHGATSIAANDNAATNPDAAEIASIGARIGMGPLLASDTKSSALLLTLTPGVYSFVVSGKASTSGIVLLEVFDADEVTPTAKFVNIAARASSTSGNGVTIGGFVVSGGVSKKVLVRAVGPTLATQGLGLSEILTNPTIELHRGAPVIATNDNWTTNANARELLSTGTRIGAAGFGSGDAASSALLLTLPPGVYSFIARGKDTGTGIVLVEVYDAD